ncbi:MAG: R3H domain-containing nucleic acid-binding protein [Verrucomicrobiota bacterium]
MNAAHSAREILEIMLRHLGYSVTIEMDEDPTGPSLHVRTPEPQALIGRKGERLDDLQHLVNKLLRRKYPDAPRVRLDVENFRRREIDQFLSGILKIADQVHATGQPVKLDPMNSYERRLVHNAFKEHPTVRSWSPEDAGRLKRITLLPRQQSTGAGG